MARREERVLAKTLCVLATNEPGDNWVFNTFRWMRSMDSMPGWELVRFYFLSPYTKLGFISSLPIQNWVLSYTSPAVFVLNPDATLADRGGHADARAAECDLLLRRGAAEARLSSVCKLPQGPAESGEMLFLFLLSVVYGRWLSTVRNIAILLCIRPVGTRRC